MATQPTACPEINQTEISYFNRCNFIIGDGNDKIYNSMSFCDYSLNIDDFFTQTTKLRGGSAFLIDDSGLGNSYGEIKVLIIKVEYSSAFTKDVDKYINLVYQGQTYPIGELHIWTGEPGTTPGLGITAQQSSLNNTSPSFSGGGLVLYNPHTGSVIVDIIIASSLNDITTSDETNIAGESGSPEYDSNLYNY